MPSFHERLREVRLEKGCTQAELAKAIGVTKSTMAKYDRGELEPNIEKIRKIASVLGVSSDYLLGKDPNEEMLRLFVSLMEDKIIDKPDVGKNNVKINSDALCNFLDTVFMAYKDWEEQPEENIDAIIRYDEEVENAIKKAMFDLEKERRLLFQKTLEEFELMMKEASKKE